ncbi:MAG: discoidin domain-containing protein, partial [Bacteroidales bacterium]|nr:discoidin domain-containing protein [Bacteroidales bacterium]
MKAVRTTLIAVGIALLATLSCTRTQSLEKSFTNPPQSAKPMVWWHWMNGNITPEGLREDILWMHRAGIGGFHVFDAGLDTPQMVEKRLAYMSPEWKDAFAGAIALADSLGMEVAIASSPGWSSTGGPWVQPADAMKKLTWSTMLLEGGKAYDCALPEPFTVSSRFQNVPLPFEYNHHQDGPIPEWYYEDIAVYAVKLPDSFRTLQELGAKVSASGGSFDVETLTDGNLDNAGLLPAHPSGSGWVQYEFPQPQSFKAVTIVNRYARSGGHGVPATCKDSLQISDDGRTWRTLCGITQGAAQEQTEYLPEASARFWRLKVPNPQASYHYGILRLPADPATQIGEFNLLSHLPINHFEEKAGFAAICDMSLYPSAADAEPSEVLDITAFCKDGRLNWTAPEGRWMIYRFGTSLTGKKKHPSSPEATGLEVDKLDKYAFARYLHTYIDMYKNAAGGLLGKHGIQYLLIDSYESGAQNWTARLPEEFRAHRGYDLLPWLPATAGVVIGSARQTEHFLWDFRRTIGELFAENYDNASAVCRNDYGMDGVFIESHEHGRNCLADGISIKKTASYPMSAMWIQSTFGGS